VSHSAVRYALVGGVLFVVDFLVTKALLDLAHQGLWVSQWSGRLAGAALGYWLHRHFSFARRFEGAPSLYGRNRRSHLRYWAGAFALWFGSPLVLRASLEYASSLLVAKIITEALLVGINYAYMRFFVFDSRRS
jgi:putative flippase GtrA